MNEPYLISTALPAGSKPRLIAKSEKFTPPTTFPRAGMITSPTIEDTILPNAAPMITPTAKSTTFPFIANSLNSDAIPIAFSLCSTLPHTPKPDDYLELSVQSYSNHGNRPTVTVVGGMIDPLIVQTQVREIKNRCGIVAFYDLFGTRVRQPAIANQNAQPAGI